MGILCDLFLAEPADAPDYEASFDDEEAADKFEVVTLGGLTQLQFEILWAITEGRPWSPETHAFDWVGDPPEGDAESWLFRFAPVFVTRLAGMTDAEVATAATKWAGTEGMDCTAEEIAPVVKSLVELARSGVASNRGLYLWGSL